ncbi:transcriptional repressor [Alkalimonas delamerensis]|uniref:Ferric uptake regulation protein n=1 Tax=Alkalimonas delamerensis TaxID=265981 RepID=A0ABT9GLH1_9GAMM|nr:transcriptional repressor [Alkalimonas delamerensis]MDP4527769.1 transcriptional repressor [Alkalimonas delamerensis]
MSVEVLVDKARLVCMQKGSRFTAIREKVFRLLAKTESGVGAYELLEELKQTEPGAKPATIYRALEFLTEQGFIHKIESNNAFMLCQHFDHQHPAQLLICEQCGHVTELHSHSLDKAFRDQAAKEGFHIGRQTMEAHGICNRCRESH